MTSTPITARQREVLQFLRNFQGPNGYMPTVWDTSQHFCWNSPHAAETHIVALIRKGLITRTKGAARSIQLTPAALELLGAASPLPAESRPDMLRLPVVDMWKFNRLTGRVR